MSGAYSSAYATAFDVGFFSLASSRVYLEPILAALLETGTPEALADAEAIRAELAGRAWQNVNPYATT